MTQRLPVYAGDSVLLYCAEARGYVYGEPCNR